MPATPPPARGVPQVPEEGCPGLPASRAAHRRRQLRRAQAPRRAGLARQAPPDLAALQPISGFWLNMIEIFSASSPARRSAAARSPRQGPHHRDREIHRRLKRTLPALQLDSDRDAGERRRNRRRRVARPVCGRQALVAAVESSTQGDRGSGSAVPIAAKSWARAARRIPRAMRRPSYEPGCPAQHR